MFALAAESREKQPTADVDLSKGAARDNGSPQLAQLDRPPLLRDNPRRRRRAPERFPARFRETSRCPTTNQRQFALPRGGHGEFDLDLYRIRQSERRRTFSGAHGRARSPAGVHSGVDPAPDRERRRIARDAAIVAAAAVMSGTSVSGRAKELENKLIRYISGDWQRRESELAEAARRSNGIAQEPVAHRQAE